MKIVFRTLCWMLGLGAVACAGTVPSSAAPDRSSSSARSTQMGHATSRRGVADSNAYSVRSVVATPEALRAGDDEAWSTAERIDWGPAEAHTRFAALRAPDGLWVRFDVDDADPWHTEQLDDGPLWNEEVVEIFLDPDGSGDHYAEVEISPANVITDVHVVAVEPAKKLDIDWDLAGLRSEVRERVGEDGGAAGWTAVALLPWSGLASLPSSVAPRIPVAGDRWRFNVYRIERPGGSSDPERGAIYAAWSPTRPRDFHVPSAFREMVFEAPAQPQSVADAGPSNEHGELLSGTRVWSEEVVIPTYPLRASDPNPHFFELEGSPIYPYTMQDSLSTELVNRTYRALFLENRYLRVMCLPEIGGRIQSVYDKVRGEEMFYRNRVIKPGLIALRGAWVSAGIEWNRGPQGHTVTSFSPVDVLPVENVDGSASLLIGNTEMNFRTGWEVRLTLHPDSAALDERIRLFNPTDGFHPYYFWNNTAFPNRPGTRFIYPMSLGSDHDGVNFFSWPEHEGRDLTWLRNYPAPTSVFAHNAVFDFFGGYDVDRDYGVVQVADHRILPGKKAWTWGQAEGGLASQSVLTDNDGPYIEIQSGPLPTQADFAFLAPGQEVSWQEVWYPVAGLGDGFEYATRHAAVQRRGGAAAFASGVVAGGGRQNASEGVEFRLLTTVEAPGARWELTPQSTTPGSDDANSGAASGAGLASDADRARYAETIDLSPLHPAVVRLPIDPAQRVHVRLTDHDGRVLLEYDSPLQVPDQAPPTRRRAPASATVERLYLRGQDADRKGDRARARELYRAVLETDARHAPTLTALAILDIEAGRYVAAESRLLEALERDPDSTPAGMRWYLRGVAALHRGELAVAESHARAAAARFGTAALGHELAGRVLMRRGEAAEAVVAFEAALAAGGRERANEGLMIALLASGRSQEAERMANNQISSGTLRPVAHAVAALAALDSAPATDGLASFAQRLADFTGEDEFAVLELAWAFADLGRLDEASELLRAGLELASRLVAGEPNRSAGEPTGSRVGASTEGRSGGATARPLPLYMLAWLEAQRATHAGRQVSEDGVDGLLRQAATIDADAVFPSRPEMLTVFRWAIDRRPDDARTHLYLGNLLAGLGRLAEAPVAWAAAARLDPSLTLAARNLGMVAWKLDGDLASAVDWLATAHAGRPSDQVVVRDLATVLIEQGRHDEAIGVLEKSSGVGGGDGGGAGDSGSMSSRGDVAILLAQTYVDVERYSDAIDMLSASSFSNWEGNRGSWAVFSNAHLERGKRQFESGSLSAALANFEAALTYPANLNVGRPHEPREAKAEYWRGRALEAMGRANEARLAWRACAEGAPNGNEQRRFATLCRSQLVESARQRR